MVLWHFETLRYQEGVPQVLALLELAPLCITGNPYGVIGTTATYVYLTKVFQFQFQVCVGVGVLVDVQLNMLL